MSDAQYAIGGKWKLMIIIAMARGFQTNAVAGFE